MNNAQKTFDFLREGDVVRLHLSEKGIELEITRGGKAVLLDDFGERMLLLNNIHPTSSTPLLFIDELREEANRIRLLISLLYRASVPELPASISNDACLAFRVERHKTGPHGLQSARPQFTLIQNIQSPTNKGSQ